MNTTDNVQIIFIFVCKFHNVEMISNTQIEFESLKYSVSQVAATDFIRQLD